MPYWLCTSRYYVFHYGVISSSIVLGSPRVYWDWSSCGPGLHSLSLHLLIVRYIPLVSNGYRYLHTRRQRFNWPIRSILRDRSLILHWWYLFIFLNSFFLRVGLPAFSRLLVLGLHHLSAFGRHCPF